jgi:hypothetical protein
MQIRFFLFGLILAVFTQCMFASNRKLYGDDVEILRLHHVARHL